MLFVNLTQELLRNEYISIMDPKHFIIEILEDINDDSNLESTLAAFREKGYVFAMDDYTGKIIRTGSYRFRISSKVDFRLTDKKVQTAIAQKYKGFQDSSGRKNRNRVKNKNGPWITAIPFAGVLLFKPVLLSKEKTEIALTTYMRLLKEFSSLIRTSASWREIIMMDVNLSYKFLMRGEHPAVWREVPGKTVKQSLVRMGLIEVRRWTLAILLSDVFGKKDNETTKRALIRGCFCRKTG